MFLLCGPFFVPHVCTRLSLFLGRLFFVVALFTTGGLQRQRGHLCCFFGIGTAVAAIVFATMRTVVAFFFVAKGHFVVFRGERAAGGLVEEVRWYERRELGSVEFGYLILTKFFSRVSTIIAPYSLVNGQIIDRSGRGGITT